MPVKFSKLETVRYVEREEPDCSGVFLCLTQLDDTDFTDDIVLLFDGMQWCYPRSDQIFRGRIYGIIGPIERLGVRFMQQVRAAESAEGILDV
jgi:hypothetical protein